MILDTDTGHLRQTMKCPSWIKDAAFADGSNKVRAICDRDSIEHTDELMLEWDIAQAQATTANYSGKQVVVTSSRDGERQAIYLPLEQLVSIGNRDGLEMHSFAVPGLRQYLQPSMQLDRVETNTRWFLPGVRLTFSRNGQYLCVEDNTGSFEKAISILETDTGRVCWKPEDETVDNDPLSRLLSRTLIVLSPDQRYVARCGPGKVVVISLDDPNDRFEIETKARSNVTFSPDGQRLIVEDRQSAGLDRPDPGRMQFWDPTYIGITWDATPLDAVKE